MTREQFIEKWKIVVGGWIYYRLDAERRFRLGELTVGKLTEENLALPQQIERALGQMYDQMANQFKLAAAPQQANGKPDLRVRTPQ